MSENRSRPQENSMATVRSRRQATAVDPPENPRDLPDYCILCMKTPTNATSNIIDKNYIWPYNQCSKRNRHGYN